MPIERSHWKDDCYFAYLLIPMLLLLLPGIAILSLLGRARESLELEGLLIYFLLNLIVIPAWVLPADQITDEAGEEELRAEDECRERHEERGVLAEQIAIDTVAEVIDLLTEEPAEREEADEKDDAADETKDMHRFLAKVGEKPQRQQIEITIEETVDAELRVTVFTGLMVHDFLPDLGESGVLGQIWDISVHLSIDLNILHYVAVVSLQSAVEVMEIVDSRDLARRSVEELRRNCLRQRVIAFLLVARDEVIAFILDHVVEARDLVGRVLEVSVHGDDHIALSLLKTAVESRALTVVAPELDSLDVAVLLRQLLDDVPGVVSGTVVDKDDLVREVVGLHDALDPGVQFRQRFCLIEKGYYNRYIHDDVFFLF